MSQAKPKVLTSNWNQIRFNLCFYWEKDILAKHLVFLLRHPLSAQALTIVEIFFTKLPGLKIGTIKLLSNKFRIKYQSFYKISSKT